MILKYVYGTPFETGAVVGETLPGTGEPSLGTVALTDGFRFTCPLAEGDIVYGLGEANRGINKRGYRYVSWCSDDPEHTEDKQSLYGAHNFLVIAGERSVGLFFDYPSAVTFDVGYTRQDRLEVSCGRADLALYVIDGPSPYDVVRQFRRAIGRSYIPPKFAFGFGQSRWGYRTREDFLAAADGYRENHIPLDMVYLDIDYMQDFKDFTVNGEQFPDFPGFVREMRDRRVRLIPIIDAGVKVEPGYRVYEEGVAGGYFCRRQDGSPFTAVVWPGDVHFPDFLSPEARAWFGEQYRELIDQGIEGFWNDMNEPAIFRSPDGVEEVMDLIESIPRGELSESAEKLLRQLKGLSNSMADYRRFYHRVDGRQIRHDELHNLYGYNMTRAAGEAFARIAPDRRILLFSRASYIGAHRYGGVWMGDNNSWWSHLLLNLKMLPSLNMCGFLYTGADLGGFGKDVTRDLLLRWLALGVFTPLMRDHSAAGTRSQECWRFENPEDFRHVIGVRYRLLPYLYSEFMKAALDDDLYCKPLAFVYDGDPIAAQVEDQVMIGDEIMIAPVYTQNARGRCVYLPEEMLFVKFQPDGAILQRVLEKGTHYVPVALNEVPLFIRRDRCIPVAPAGAEYVEAVDWARLELLGYSGASYELYDDDGLHSNCGSPENRRILYNQTI